MLNKSTNSTPLLSYTQPEIIKRLSGNYLTWNLPENNTLILIHNTWTGKRRFVINGDVWKSYSKYLDFGSKDDFKISDQEYRVTIRGHWGYPQFSYRLEKI